MQIDKTLAPGGGARIVEDRLQSDKTAKVGAGVKSLPKLCDSMAGGGQSPPWVP